MFPAAGQRCDGGGAHREEPGDAGLQERFPVGRIPPNRQTSRDGQHLIYQRLVLLQERHKRK